MRENKKIFYSAATFLLVVSFAVFGAKILVDNISFLSDQLQQNKQTEATLQTKLSSLGRVLPQATNDSVAAINALPAGSPVISVMSNIRTQATSFGLTLNNFSSSTVPDTLNKGTLSGEVVFDIDGNYKNIISLIDRIRGTSPVTTFDSIKILSQGSLGGDDYRFTGHLLVYWAGLPTTIPPVSQSFEGLTADEKKILSQISSLNVPPVSVVTGAGNPTTNSNRSDPFSL